jgi:hypothetical protein
MKSFLWMSDVSTIDTYSNSASESDGGSNESNNYCLLERLRQIEDEFVSYREIAVCCKYPKTWAANIWTALH